MAFFYQFVGITFTVIITYLFFRGFGNRNDSLLYSRGETTAWNAALKTELGSLLVITSITGTLTSFPTLIFLLGTVKLFGWFSLATGISVLFSALVTNWLTLPVRHAHRFSSLLSANDQVSGVIANLFWGKSRNQQLLSQALKYISITAIAALVWLDFFAFSEFTTAVHGASSFVIKTTTMLISTFAVVYFVMRYGIRGFVFADLLHAPLIGLVVLTILCFLLFFNRAQLSPSFVVELAKPQLDQTVLGIPYLHGIIFAAHVVVLNTLQVVCSEHHWFRMWLLQDKEIDRQPYGTAATGVLWLLMLPIGFLAYKMSGQIGEGAIVHMLNVFESQVPILSAVFWVGATAALFASADLQSYAGLLVYQFDCNTGKIRDFRMTKLRALVSSFVISVLFAMIYFANLKLNLKVEKILFVIVPFITTLAPAFIHYRFGKEPRAWVIAVSAVGYVTVAATGFLLPDTNFFATLSAVFVPVFVSLVTLPFMNPLHPDGRTVGGSSCRLQPP